MSNNKKSSKKRATKATVPAQAPEVKASEPLRIEAPVEPHVAKEPSTGKPGEMQKTAGLSPLILCALAMSGATLLAVLILSWSISEKLRQIGEAKQADRLIASLHRNSPTTILT